MRFIFLIVSLLLLLLACKKEPLAPLPDIPNVAVVSTDTIPDGGWFKIHIKHDTSIIDETVLVFQRNASPYYTPQADAVYFQGFGIAAISSLTADSISCAIQALPFRANSSLKLHVGIRQSGTFNIGISAISNIPSGIKVLLVDNLSSDTTDLRLAGYSFTSLPVGINTPDSKRFKLLLK